jgi:serine/threonine protein kinase
MWCPVCRARYRARYTSCPRHGEELVACDDALIGTVIADSYYIDALLGEGALGAVYRARHTRISRELAVKIPYGDVAVDPAARRRFAAEAEAASRLAHPNVVGAVDVGETEDGLPYLVMDLAEGPTLASMIDDGPLAPARALAIVAQIARGLAHAHARGLVHRDLKPDNIIVEAGDRPRIVDFGISLLGDANGDDQRLTERGVVVGTPAYMAPEQALGKSVDARTDLFALGLIAYELLAGALPHDGTPMEIVRKYVTSAVPSIRARAPHLVLPPGTEAVIQWMLQRQPVRRPPDAATAADAIERLLAPVRTRPRSRRLRIGMPALRDTISPLHR